MRQQGFSLIELVVTMAVLVSVATIAIPAFQASIGNAQIRTVAESIHSGLQQARMEAIKRNARVKFTLQTNGAWQIGCMTPTTTCPTTITQKSAMEGSSSNTTVAPDNTTAVFSGFGTRDPATPVGLSVVNITNAQVRNEERRALRVLLAAGGNVKVCDPTVTTLGDTRAC
ncbi:GspH/FimT family pseudopilin [Methylophilus sp. 5]|uniref:GspH/FimT family pseudopilin n=1 Tax=Methylophilus sp. 5 TaxID=1112274 RepID=UPI00048DC576|nr:GspH/FimT family pseudopilin [Methylophilus sp. 5]